MKVDYIFFGWGWDGEIKSLDYSPEVIKSTTKPSMGAVGPGGITKAKYRPAFADYRVEEFIADDGSVYLLAVAGEAPQNDINEIISNTFPPPKPYR
ncbi:hypothetical protein [Serratia proteamaculans]|uniref:hypothetical protein n=1 Tax=Serratia proteamaculans TaxID=28151 RepID=UPI0039AFB15A